MNISEFKSEVEKLGISINDDILNKLEIYKNFLIEYNTHTNLTAIKEEKDIYLKHFYDSLTITKVIDLNKVNNLIDIGTGAGFPGMVIKIFYPNVKVTLLDSNNKKTKFLELLKDKLNLDVEIVNDRVENYSKNNLNKFDIVTSRAVANLRVLSELCLPLVKENGYFIPLKGNIEEELNDSLDTINIMKSKIMNRVEFNLYNNNGIRNILLIKKEGTSNINDIRPYDKIVKKPLKNNR
jgi:16S rRNA (guanine527-N7)-methyltransferase